MIDAQTTSSADAVDLRHTSASAVDPRSARSPMKMLLLRGVLQRLIRYGTLTLAVPNGRSYVFGEGAPQVTIRIKDWATVGRLLINPDLAVGEAYMNGSLVLERGSLYDFVALCCANLRVGEGHWVQRARAFARRLGRRLTQYNPVSVARANVAHHYDLSDVLYDHFLDADRQYSCAYHLSVDDTLEQAQEQKKRHLAAKLLLQPGQRVLDIGSGWGGLGIYLARIAGATVTGVTLSTEQLRYANQRAQQEGLADKVQFLLKDYRHETGRYDRIVSVGMFEHVGIGHYREFFEKVRDLLTDDGIALIHTIGSVAGPSAPHPWIRKYIFPGGYAPALSEVVPAIERAGLVITDIEVLRLHYAETLKAWRQRFLENRDRIATIYDQRFCRMWEFYLAGCEASFRHSGLVNFQIQISKRIDGAPLTRDYMIDWERKTDVSTNPSFRAPASHCNSQLPDREANAVVESAPSRLVGRS